MHPVPRSMHAIGLRVPLIACKHIPTGDVARQAALMWLTARRQAVGFVGSCALSGQVLPSSSLQGLQPRHAFSSLVPQC